MNGYGPISLRLHGYLDHLLVVAGLVAPWLFGFSEYVGATLYTVALVLFGFGLNAVTDYPGGIWKILPFAWHRYVEWAAPPPFIIVPWLFFADAGPMPVVLSALGTGIVLNALLTRPLPAAVPG